jgi:hypothetical protein
MLPILIICALPCLARGDFSSIFLSAAPISEFLHLEHTPVSPFDGVDAGGAQTFPQGIQHFSRLRLLLAAPSDNRWRQRESFNAVEDRCKQPPRHSHFGELERHIFRVSRYLRPDLDELLS